MELRGISIPYAKNKARATRLYIENLEKRMMMALQSGESFEGGCRRKLLKRA